MKINSILVLSIVAMTGILMVPTLLPAYGAFQSCSSDNGNICVNWYFLDQKGTPVDTPSPILIDTTHTHEATIKWYVASESGKGTFQFKTIPHVSKATPGMIKNCEPFPIQTFNGTTQLTGQYECTINASDNVGLGTLEIDLAVNNGKSLPFYDANNHFVGTSFQYSTDVVVGPNAVPEFGQISTLVLIISIVSVILFSTRLHLIRV